jgi:tryptophanyl-tRNA synthetase
VGDVEVKQKLAKAVNAFLDPFRERREKFASQSGLVDEVIWDGTQLMRAEARLTLQEVRKAMGISSVWNRIARKAEDVKKKRERV